MFLYTTCNMKIGAVGIIQPTAFKLSAHWGVAFYTVCASAKHASSLFSSCKIWFLFSFPAEDSDS